MWERGDDLSYLITTQFINERGRSELRTIASFRKLPEGIDDERSWDQWETLIMEKYSEEGEKFFVFRTEGHRSIPLLGKGNCIEV